MRWNETNDRWELTNDGSTYGNIITTADSGTITSTMIADGTIANADISTTAAIQLSKLASGSSAQIVLANATGVPTYATISGDVTITNAGDVQIAANAISNADISTTAAIDHSKLASITAGSILMGNATNVPVATAISGDVTLASNGNVQIASNVITNADIITTAQISHSKLANATAGQILLGTTTTGVITATTISGDVTVDGAGNVQIAANTIVNADINSAAAIELGKLADVLFNQQTVSYTLVAGDKNKIVEVSNTGTTTLTIPADNTVNFATGTQIHILQTNTGQVTIAGNSGVTVNGTPGLKIRSQWSSVTLIKRAANTWVAVGDLSA